MITIIQGIGGRNLEYFFIIRYLYYPRSDTVLFESGIGLVGNVYLANARATIKSF